MSTTLEFNKITDEERSTLGVSALSDRPNETGLYGVGGLNAKELKNWFDKFANLLANKFNAFCDVFKGEGGEDVAQYIKLQNFGSYETMRDVLEGIKDGTFANTMMAYASASAEGTSSLQSIINGMAASLSSAITTSNLTDYIIDSLTSDDATKALSAKQGKALKASIDLKIAIASIADDLTTNDATKVLSAKQGKKLNDEKIDKTSIADNLTTDDNTKVLSAKQGKDLDNKKVEKYTTSDGKKYAYTVDNGVQGKTEITETPTDGKLAVYGANGVLKTGDPVTDTDASKEVPNVKFVRGKINGLSVDLVMDSSSYTIKAILKSGTATIAESSEIDLPLETLIANLTYSKGNIVVTLKNGTTTSIPITDVIEDSDFYYLLVSKNKYTVFSKPEENDILDVQLSDLSRTPVIGEYFVLFLTQHNVNPSTMVETEVDSFVAHCEVKEITNSNKVKVEIKSIYSTKGATGAKMLSQSFSSFDIEGNAVYEQTFDDGTTATFTAYTGKAGRTLYAQTVLYENPGALLVESQQLLIIDYFNGNQVNVDHPLRVGEQFCAMFEYNNNSYLAVCEIVSLSSEQFTYRVVNYSTTTGIQGNKGDTGLTYTAIAPTINFIPQIGDVYKYGASEASDNISHFNRTPVVGEIYTKYYNYNGQNGVITYMVTQVITAIDSTTGGITAQVQDVHVLTGAVPVSTTFVGTDANGGNVYSISFSNGTTSTITAPKGEGSSIGLFNGKSIDRYIFNKRISINQLEAYFSTLTYENGVSLLVDTIAGIGVYAVRMSDLDASGSGYAIAVVTVEEDGATTINEIVFFSQYSLANVAIAQNALGDETFTYSEAGWLGNGYYVLPSQTQVDGSVDVAVNSFVSSDNSFWNMVYGLVDKEKTKVYENGKFSENIHLPKIYNSLEEVYNPVFDVETSIGVFLDEMEENSKIVAKTYKKSDNQFFEYLTASFVPQDACGFGLLSITKKDERAIMNYSEISQIYAEGAYESNRVFLIGDSLFGVTKQSIAKYNNDAYSYRTIPYSLDTYSSSAVYNEKIYIFGTAEQTGMGRTIIYDTSLDEFSLVEYPFISSFSNLVTFNSKIYGLRFIYPSDTSHPLLECDPTTGIVIESPLYCNTAITPTCMDAKGDYLVIGTKSGSILEYKSSFSTLDEQVETITDLSNIISIAILNNVDTTLNMWISATKNGVGNVLTNKTYFFNGMGGSLSIANGVLYSKKSISGGGKLETILYYCNAEVQDPNKDMLWINLGRLLVNSVAVYGLNKTWLSFGYNNEKGEYFYRRDPDYYNSCFSSWMSMRQRFVGLFGFAIQSTSGWERVHKINDKLG